MRKNDIFILIGSLGLTCLVLASVRSFALQDDVKWLPNQVGKWKPSTMDDESRVDYNFSQHEFDTYVEKLKRLAEMTREPKALNPPLGVDAFHSFSIQSPPYSGVQKPRSYIPVVGILRLILEPYFESRNGQIDLDPDNEAWLTFYINTLNPIFRGERYTHKEVVEDWLASGEPPNMEDEQGLYFYAPKVVGDLQGFPIYDTAAVVLVKSQKPLWVPVNQERFLRHAIRKAEENLKTRKEEQKAEMAKLAEPLPDDPELAKVVKEAREEGRKEGEKLTRESEASLRAGLAENPGEIRFLPADYVQALTQELASLSPAERAAPAYYSSNWMTTRRPSGLLDPTAPQAQPVVSPNPDFFDPTLPRTAIQVIVVLGISSRDRAPAHPEKANPAAARFFEVRNALDWKKVAALVE
jgi:hypothetical protein